MVAGELRLFWLAGFSPQVFGRERGDKGTGCAVWADSARAGFTSESTFHCMEACPTLGCNLCQTLRPCVPLAKHF